MNKKTEISTGTKIGIGVMTTLIAASIVGICGIIKLAIEEVNG